MAEDAVAGYLSVLNENKQEIPAEKQSTMISEIFAEIPLNKASAI